MRPLLCLAVFAAVLVLGCSQSSKITCSNIRCAGTDKKTCDEVGGQFVPRSTNNLPPCCSTCLLAVGQNCDENNLAIRCKGQPCKDGKCPP